jgi:hypothetical protein
MKRIAQRILTSNSILVELSVAASYFLILYLFGIITI